MAAGWGFDYSFFDTATFDGATQQTLFETELHKKMNSPTLRFYFDDAYYDAMLLSAPQIVRSSDLTAGFTNFIVQNTDQSWNAFITDKTNLGRPCSVGLYFTGINWIVQLFEGIVEGASFNGATVNLQVRDKMSTMLEKQIGDGQSYVDAYTLAYDPGELVWELLTGSTYGELDDTAGLSNEDIDYADFLAWQADCVTLGYELKGRFTGQTIRTLLKKIADYTNSVIWIDGLGKFRFDMYNAPWGGSAVYDVDDSLKIDLDIRKSNLINYAQVFYGYSPLTDAWTNSTFVQDTSSQSSYGLRKRVIEDKVVWHTDVTSAGVLAQALIDKHAAPEEILKLHTTMKGYILVIGERIYVTEALKNITNREYWVEKISLNLEDGTAEVEARKI